MDVFTNLVAGFAVALSPTALLYCLFGVTLGTVVGLLPGLGPLAVIALSLPFTYAMTPAEALIFLSGIFYGSQYGNSIASVMLNMPGTPSAAVTCLDGYPMRQQGRAGLALFTCAASAFIGGTLAIILMMFASPLLATMAMGFTSAEYTTIMLLGLVSASTLSLGSPFKGLTMVAVGLMLGTVGIDAGTGIARFTFGTLELTNGLGLVAVAIGLFGISEVIFSLKSVGTSPPKVEKVTLSSMLPKRDEWMAMLPAALRGTVVGAWIGVLPGAGALLATFMAYALEKRVSKHPEKFGKGALQGLASPEAASNSAAQTSFVPTLSLGIPGDPVMAVLLGALLLHGLQPGPTFITSHPDLFWGLIASFWIGNLLLLVLNIPMIGVWIRVLSFPYKYLFPALLLLACIGVYSVRNSPFDVMTAIIFGLAGVFLRRFGYPVSTLILGFVLGPMLEEHFVRAMLISGGNFSVFVSRPISLVFVLITGAILAGLIFMAGRKFLFRKTLRTHPDNTAS